jgi:hypothetical protein
MKNTVNTTWECWNYDVWGNKQEGYTVNDRSCFNRNLELTLPVIVYNDKTPHKFSGASISDYKIKQIFGVSCKIEVSGDDITYYIERASDGYPIGEMTCTSHGSLSPIRIYLHCDSCDLASINGIACHEVGCPNSHSSNESESDES